jgi:molecular chaperone DnaK (HSP70)
VDVWQDPKNEAGLLDNCEKAKRHLSKTNSVSIVADLANHAVEVSRSEFEARTSPLLLQTEMLLDKVLEDAQKQHSIGITDIDVLLTGGSSKMPMVRQMIQAKIGKPPLQHGNPELLVTIGAAYWAYLLEGGIITRPIPDQNGVPQPTPIVVKPGGITDISAYDVGIEVLRPDNQGRLAPFNLVLLATGARYGETKDREFRVAEDGVTEVHIVLYKGDSTDISQCEQLMTFTISGLPSGRPKGAPVKVTLGYDSSGILRGKAVDVLTGREVEIVVDRTKAASFAA